MLIQANESEVILLPALPREWVSGTLQGVRLPGGGTLDIEWDETTVRCKVIRASEGNTKFFHKCNETFIVLATGPIEEFSFLQNPSHYGKAVV